MSTLLALLLAAAVPDTGDAPAYRDLGLPLTLASEEQQGVDPDPERPRIKDERPKYNLGLEVSGHYSMPFGYANRDVAYLGSGTVVIDATWRWSDLFNGGWGTSLTAMVNVVGAGRGSGTAGRSKSKFSAGGYLTFTQDHFSGGSDADERGNSITVEDLETTSYIIGVLAYQDMGDGAFVDGRFGIGAVHYGAVEADGRSTGSFGTNVRSTFLEETWGFATEVRGGGGYRFGPIALRLGIGVRLWTPPDAGPTVNIDSGIFWTFDIDLGVELNF